MGDFIQEAAPLAGIAALIASGGTAAPEVLAAEGAGAGTAAGGGLLGGGMFGAAPQIAGALPAIAPVEEAAIPALTAADGAGGTMTAFGPSGEYWGKAITDTGAGSMGLTPNAYTGGFDSLNGIQRIGQRIGGAMDGMSNGFKLPNMPQQTPTQRTLAPAMPKQPLVKAPVDNSASYPYGNNASQGINLSQLTPDQQKLLMARGLL